MASVRQQYRDISPVTLQVVGGAVSSSLYCGEVDGVGGGLVESFLVELFRCKLCQFTCSPKAAINNHLLLKHRPPTLTYLTGADGGGEAEDREGEGLQQGASPYQLDLNGESKQSDEEDFLLYNMLDNMSPPTCDIGSEGGLQVAHTCEVSTLFEEEASIFPLKAESDGLSAQEETAQSAHLMTLGLCRISAAKPPPSAPPPSSSYQPAPPPPVEPTSPSQPRRQSLPCLLCPLKLPSRRRLDIHMRSHCAAGGFSCVSCSWTSDTWEELEPHLRSHRKRKERERRRDGGRRREEGRRRKRRSREASGEGQQQQEKHKKKKKVTTSRLIRGSASRNTHKQKHSMCKQRRHDNRSEGQREHIVGRAGGKEAEPTDKYQAGSLQGVTERKKTEEKEPGLSCSLCDRKFSSKLTLRRHLGVHGGIKPFSCTHCSYSSRLKASLLQHLRTHTGERPYRCADCAYASIDRSSLLRHRRTHSQERPYRCGLCDYSSIQKKSLDLHARRHHTGEAFPCRQCEYSSPDPQLLLRHTRRHHAPSEHAVL